MILGQYLLPHIRLRNANTFSLNGVYQTFDCLLYLNARHVLMYIEAVEIYPVFFLQ